MTEKQLAKFQAQKAAGEKMVAFSEITAWACCFTLFIMFGFKSLYIFGFGFVAFVLIWIYFTVFDVGMDDEYHEPNYRNYEPTPAPTRVPKPEPKPKSAGVVIDEAAGTVEWEVIR